jgi:alpha-glucosidase
LLVAPVVEKSAEIKRVYLPPGEWLLFNGGTKYKGGQWIDFPVTLEAIPLFVRSGSIIPMMPVMQYIHQQKNYPIILKVFPKNSGKISFELYEDDGISNDYKKDVASKRKITCESSKDQITLTVDPDKQSRYKPEQRNFLIDIPVSAKPSAVLVDGKKIKPVNTGKLMESLSEQFISTLWCYDKEKQKMVIRMPDTLAKVTAEIKY